MRHWNMHLLRGDMLNASVHPSLQPQSLFVFITAREYIILLESQYRGVQQDSKQVQSKHVTPRTKYKGCRQPISLQKEGSGVLLNTNDLRSLSHIFLLMVLPYISQPILINIERKAKSVLFPFNLLLLISKPR